MIFNPFSSILTLATLLTGWPLTTAKHSRDLKLASLFAASNDREPAPMVTIGQSWHRPRYHDAAKIDVICVWTIPKSNHWHILVKKLNTTLWNLSVFKTTLQTSVNILKNLNKLHILRLLSNDVCHCGWCPPWLSEALGVLGRLELEPDTSTKSP